MSNNGGTKSNLPVRYIKTGWLISGIILIISAFSVSVATGQGSMTYTTALPALVIFLLPIPIIMKVFARMGGVNQKGLILSCLYFVVANGITWGIENKGFKAFLLLIFGVGSICMYVYKKKHS